MDFLNSLAQVAKNQKNFKTWEEEQANNNAQRQELAQRRHYTKAELDAAKQLGETIIDVVDIMDNHSENVAENVETAVQPVVGLAPVIAMFGGGAIIGKKLIMPAERTLRNLREKHFWNNEEANKLADAITEDIRKTRPKHDSFDSSDFASKRYIDKIKNPELKKQAQAIHDAYMKEAKTHLRKIRGGGLAVLGLTIGSFIGANIFASALQVGSSKIARYQARKILEDPKAFVKYTPEQIAAAKQYIEAHPELKKDKKKDKLKSGLFSSIYNVIKDNKAYKKAKASEVDSSKKIDRVLSPEELKQAQRDKEVIQRSVRIINNEAEKYSENMEVAAGVIMGSTPIVGGFFGWLTGIVMNKTGLTNKIINNTVEKYGTDEAKEAFKRFKEVKEGAPGYTTRWSKFFSKFMNDRKNPLDSANKAASKKSLLDTFMPRVKKLFAAGLAHKWGNAKIIGVIGAFASAIPAALIALKLQKSAARAGRYTAKRELEKDPTNFIGYTEEDYNEVKDVKGKKQTFGQKVKELALFVPNVMKQYYAYDKYKRTEFKDKQLLVEQLQKSDNITSEQLRDAKNLQRKLFNTFEKVDDNSQIYSESMEAAVEIAQPFALYASLLAMISPLIYTGYQIQKGKMSAAALTESITRKLASASNFLKSKTFKKYLDNVSENIPHKVGSVDLQHKPIAAMIQGMNFEQDTIGELGAKLIRNARANAEDFGQLSNYEQIKLIKNIEKSIDNLKIRLDLPEDKFKSTLDFLKKLQSDEYTPKLRTDMLNLLIKNTTAIQKMSDENFSKAVRKYVDIMYDNIGEDKIRQILGSLDKLVERYPDMEDLMYSLLNKYGKYRVGDASIFDPNAFKKALVELIDKKTYAEKSQMIDNFFSRNFSKEAFPYKIKDVASKIDEIIEHGDDIFHDGASRKARAIAGEVDGTVPPPKSRLKQEIDNILNPKSVIANIKAKVEKMSVSEFQDLADKMHMSSMDKATMLKILPNLEKIMDNIPKEQLNKVFNSLATEFRKNPDEVIKLVSSGKVAQIFMTKGLVNTAAALGISWFALNVLLTWAIQSWLADMQLKAGRLGVMKAMESLDDPAYYANLEVDKKQIAQYIPSNPKVINAQEKGNLLNKYRQ